jgi:putative peptide zinc metalloprotease protein
MQGNLFSESWFKVADLRVGLLSSVDVQKQYYRHSLWYVVRDRFNNDYFRVTPEAYEFIAMLTPERTVQQIWEECLETYRDKAPSQDEVISLLSQLHTSNLLYFDNPSNSEFVFERHFEKKRKELRNRILSFISIRVPLWNPDEWLNRMAPYVNAIFSWKGFILWIAVLLFGLKVAADNVDKLYDQTQGMLAPSNLVFIYFSMAFLKLFHEICHAMMNKRFGGPVHAFGVMFLVFTPLPYMDATSSWFFQKRLHRVLVGTAGMMSDLFFAAIAAVVWANTGDGLIHSLAFNMIIVGSVTSIFFNGNPLIRFDAYYILSDLLEIPNLYQRSRSQWLYWVETYLFKVENTLSPSNSFREALWLGVYAAASLLYRIFISIVIILVVADRFFAVGLVLAIVMIFTGVFFPVKAVLRYLFSSPRLGRTRKRACIISGALTASAVVLIGFCPFMYSILKESSKRYISRTAHMSKKASS